MTDQKALEAATRPIIGIANRTAQEVFDIMCDRIRFALHPAPDAREAGLREAQSALSSGLHEAKVATDDFRKGGEGSMFHFAQGVEEGWRKGLTAINTLLSPALVGEKPPDQTLAEVKDALGLPQDTSTADTFRASLDHARRAVGEKVETDDGWIEWKGGPMPVRANTTVDVTLRGAPTEQRLTAGALTWAHHDSQYDIIAYRLSEPRK